MKKRLIQIEPRVFKFSPRGVRGRPGKVVIRMDELETLRLADLNNMKHSDAARSMNISRQTFERILKKGRRVVVDAIVNGKIIDVMAHKK